MKFNISLGVPLFLTIVFLILKLTGLLSWSWLWVLSPLWIPVVAVGVLWLLYVCSTIEDIIFKRRP